MTSVIGTPGQAYVLTYRGITSSMRGDAVDDLVIHCNRLSSIPLDVADGTTGYAVLDWDPETAPKTGGYFLDMVALTGEGLVWWVVDGATPTAASTRVGPEWFLSPLHFQVWKSGSGPWSAGSRPAVAFENNTGKRITAVATYGRYT